MHICRKCLQKHGHYHFGVIMNRTQGIWCQWLVFSLMPLSCWEISMFNSVNMIWTMTSAQECLGEEAWSKLTRLSSSVCIFPLLFCSGSTDCCQTLGHNVEAHGKHHKRGLKLLFTSTTSGAPFAEFCHGSLTPEVWQQDVAKPSDLNPLPLKFQIARDCIVPK